jgi:hypothetical protein
VCFRHREIKTLRKVRRSDSAALEKLRQLKNDMMQAKKILDMVHERETIRKATIELEIAIFEKRLNVRQIRKVLGITSEALESPEPRRKKKRYLNNMFKLIFSIGFFEF